jgi:hypothetical protein
VTIDEQSSAVPSLTLFTDISLLGWGAYLEGQTVSGDAVFHPSERSHQSFENEGSSVLTGAKDLERESARAFRRPGICLNQTNLELRVYDQNIVGQLIQRVTMCSSLILQVGYHCSPFRKITSVF